MKNASILRRIGLGLLIVVASAQGQSLQPFPHFSQAEGKTDSDGLPISGAKVCILGKPDTCYQMPEHVVDGGSVIYQFGLEPHSERLPLPGGASWVFFTATFSGGGSGTLTSFSVLRYTKDPEKIVDLLPFVAATNVSDYAMWTIPAASTFPILVDADFVWTQGEGHFDPHVYTIEAWKFDPKSDRYAKAFSYRTSRKYPGGDVGRVQVLKPERQEILKRLEQH
jgi:hypothetical protein